MRTNSAPGENTRSVQVFGYGCGVSAEYGRTSPTLIFAPCAMAGAVAKAVRATRAMTASDTMPALRCIQETLQAAVPGRRAMTSEPFRPTRRRRGGRRAMVELHTAEAPLCQ